MRWHRSGSAGRATSSRSSMRSRRCATLRSARSRSVFFVPTHFHAIFNLPPETLAKYDVSSLEMIIAGGAALPQATKETHRRAFRRGAPLRRLWQHRGRRDHQPGGRRINWCGGNAWAVVITGVEAKVVDDSGTHLPPGEIGELICRSPLMFQGYWNRAAATQEVLRDNWYYSGDLGYFRCGRLPVHRRPQEEHDHLRRPESSTRARSRKSCTSTQRSLRSGHRRREGRLLG